MSDSDYSADIIPILNEFLHVDITENPNPLREEDVMYFAGEKYLLQERVPLESSNPTCELFLEVYDYIASDSDTISNISESYLANIRSSSPLDTEYRTEDSLRSLLESQFISSEDSLSDKSTGGINLNGRVDCRKKKLETVDKKHSKKKNEEPNPKSKQDENKRLDRSEKQRVYQRAHNLKKKLIREKELLNGVE